MPSAKKMLKIMHELGSTLMDIPGVPRWRIVSYLRLCRSKNIRYPHNADLLMDPVTFMTHMYYYKKYCNPVSLSWLLRMIREEREDEIPPFSIAIILESPYLESFYTFTRCMKKCSIPGTIAIDANLVGSPAPALIDSLAIIFSRALIKGYNPAGEMPFAYEIPNFIATQDAKKSFQVLEMWIHRSANMKQRRALRMWIEEYKGKIDLCWKREQFPNWKLMRKTQSKQAIDFIPSFPDMLLTPKDIQPQKLAKIETHSRNLFRNNGVQTDRAFLFMPETPIETEKTFLATLSSNCLISSQPYVEVKSIRGDKGVLRRNVIFPDFALHAPHLAARLWTIHDSATIDKMMEKTTKDPE